jgi:hypothetical protein
MVRKLRGDQAGQLFDGNIQHDRQTDRERPPLRIDL